jgi:hypothetical protein
MYRQEQQKIIQQGVTFLRPIDGEEFRWILGMLADTTERHPDINIQLPDRGKRSPVIPLVAGRESWRQQNAQQTLAAIAIERVLSEVPSLLEPYDLAFDTVDSAQYRNGTRLIFLRSSTDQRAISERASICSILDGLTPAKKKWERLKPNVEVAYLTSRLSHAGYADLKTIFQNHLPLNAEARPVITRPDLSDLTSY